MDINNILYNIQGVRNIDNLIISNIYNNGLTNTNYSYNVYNIQPINGIIYCPRDPSIFQLKYPDTDIIGNLIIIN